MKRLKITYNNGHEETLNAERYRADAVVVLALTHHLTSGRLLAPALSMESINTSRLW